MRKFTKSVAGSRISGIFRQSESKRHFFAALPEWSFAMRMFVAAIIPLILAQVASAQQQWGDIQGRVVWKGEVPVRVPVVPKIPGIPPIPDDSWVVDPDTKALANTFVWLAPKDPQDRKAKLAIHPNLKAPPKASATVDVSAFRFAPHSLAIREGQDLLAINAGPRANNVKFTGNVNLGANNGGALLPPGANKLVAGLQADRLPILLESSIYPWMRGYVRVFDHPYFAVTDKDGKFEIKNAPVGECRLMIWHGTGGWAGGAAGRNGREIEVKKKTDLGDQTYPNPMDLP